jgi:hypothetical protein
MAHGASVSPNGRRRVRQNRPAFSFPRAPRLAPLCSTPQRQSLSQSRRRHPFSCTKIGLHLGGHGGCCRDPWQRPQGARPASTPHTRSWARSDREARRVFAFYVPYALYSGRCSSSLGGTRGTRLVQTPQPGASASTPIRCYQGLKRGATGRCPAPGRVQRQGGAKQQPGGSLSHQQSKKLRSRLFSKSVGSSAGSPQKPPPPALGGKRRRP